MNWEEFLEASTETVSLPDMWWEDEQLTKHLTWRYRVKHWTKSQRRELVRRYAKLRQDQKNWEWTWVGRFSDETVSLIISLSRTN